MGDSFLAGIDTVFDLPPISGTDSSWFGIKRCRCFCITSSSTEALDCVAEELFDPGTGLRDLYERRGEDG